MNTAAHLPAIIESLMANSSAEFVKFQEVEGQYADFAVQMKLAAKTTDIEVFITMNNIGSRKDPVKAEELGLYPKLLKCPYKLDDTIDMLVTGEALTIIRGVHDIVACRLGNG